MTRAAGNAAGNAAGRGDHGFGKPNASVDVVVLTLVDGALHACLAERVAAPFLGMPCLPGGYVHVGEDLDLEGVARRVLAEKTGVAPRFLEQLRSFGGAARDPDGWSITVAYYTMMSPVEAAASGRLRPSPVDRLPPLAFDHAEIVAAAVRRLRDKGSYSAIPAYLLPPAFTLGELQRVYEQVLGTDLDKKTFRRKVADQGIVEPAPGMRQDGPGRPARLHRLKPGVAPEFDRTIRETRGASPSKV